MRTQLNPKQLSYLRSATERLLTEALRSGKDEECCLICAGRDSIYSGRFVIVGTYQDSQDHKRGIVMDDPMVAWACGPCTAKHDI